MWKNIFLVPPALHIYEVHTDHVSWINKKGFFFKRRVKILILFGDQRDHETSSNHFEEFLMQLMEWQLSIEAYFDTYNSAADAARVMHSMSCKSQRTSKSSGSTYFQIAAWIAFSQKSRCDKFSSCYCQRSTNTAGFRYQPFWMQDKWLTQSANSKKKIKKPRKFGQSGNMTPWKFLEQNCSVDQGHRGCQQLSGVFPGTQQRSNRLVCLKSACRFLDTRRFSVISCWIMISCGKMARRGVRHHEAPVSPLPNLEEYPDGPFSKFKQHRNG